MRGEWERDGRERDGRELDDVHDGPEPDGVREHGEGWVHGDLQMKYEQVAHFQFGKTKKRRFQQPLK